MSEIKDLTTRVYDRDQAPPEIKHRIADWEPTIRVVSTPAVIEIPQGDDWQIMQVMAPPPAGWVYNGPTISGWSGLVVLELEPGGEMVIGPDGKEIVEARGKVPPSMCSFSLFALRNAAWRLAHLEDNLHVARTHRLLGWLEENLRERGPSVPGLAALEEALQLARIAWASYRTEVVQSVMHGLPFHVSAERRSRRITIRHVELLLGGGPAVDKPELPSVQVEITAYVKTSGPEFTVTRGVGSSYGL